MNAVALDRLLEAPGAAAASRLGPAVDPARFLATLAGALDREPAPGAPALARLLAELEPETGARGLPALEAPHPALAQIIASLVAAEGRAVRLTDGSAPPAPAAPTATSEVAAPVASASPAEVRPPALPIDVLRALAPPAAGTPPAVETLPAQSVTPDRPQALQAPDRPEALQAPEPGATGRAPTVRVPAPERAPLPEAARIPSPAVAGVEDAERVARAATAHASPRAELPEARPFAERVPGPAPEPAALPEARPGFTEDGSSRFGDPPPRGLHAELSAARPAAHATAEPAPGFSLAAAERVEEAAGRPAVPASRAHEALVAQVERLSQGDGGTARIRLHPQNLGELHLRVRVRGQAVEVTVLAREVAAKVLVEGGREQLAEALASRELRMESFEVHGGPREEGSGREARAERDAAGPDDRSGERPARPRADAHAAAGPESRLHPRFHHHVQPDGPTSSDDGRVHWVI